MMRGLVAVGTSLGGLRALNVLLAGLPEDFPLPVAVVQHRHRDADVTLARLLQRAGAIAVREAEDKEPIVDGCVYLAPPDYHLLVEEGYFSLSIDAPVRFARPSIDVLFESAAEACGRRAIGVILTGNNEDGAQGLATIKRHGGVAVVQDPATAEFRAMPDAAIAATPVDRILPLEEIAPFLVRLGEAWEW